MARSLEEIRKDYIAGKLISHTEFDQLWNIMRGDTVETTAATAEHSQDIDPAARLLDKAKEIVTGARRQSYGKPEDNFSCIATLWRVYLAKRQQPAKSNSVIDLESIDVAVMMILMKCARLAETPEHVDSALDIAGYAACLHRCQKEKLP